MPDVCPFCDPDPTRVAFRENLILGIWDRYPVTEGHLLLVTRRHVADWFEATDEERLALIQGIGLGRELIQQQQPADGFNIGVNVGSAAGQTIPHLHVHLIPRLTGDIPDPRGGVRHVIPDKGNYLRPRPAGVPLSTIPSTAGLLVRGMDDPLLPYIRDGLDRAVRADFAVAFILKSGVALIREHLSDLLDRQGQVRIVTGDYLDATDPDALVALLDLGGDLQLRAFESGETSFHPKAYIFYDRDGQGTAFVGSSNLTRTALQTGVEWNYRVLQAHTDHGFAQVSAALDDLFTHSRTRQVTPDWIAAYRTRRAAHQPPGLVEVVAEPPTAPPTPHAIQQDALAALQATRTVGNEAGLVVLATGLGKTWLAAFDSNREPFRRVLFVAHREEILKQAKHPFRCLRPEARLGTYTGKEKTPDADVLFASIQTLGKARHLEQFDREHFDYIIVDEFHHAAARTYRQLIEYFSPRFLLGLTATPERMDGGDLLALCQENLVIRRDLVDGIDADLLCPFRYFGVPDEVDYANIPWRSSRFDEEALTQAVATTTRAENALDQHRQHAGSRTLGFCCSQRHADFMADYFSDRNVRAVAVHAGERSAPRATALQKLADGELNVIFSVDMFNEGLDIPQIDTVLMLRPTLSPTIWLQQFGRGLRKAESKPELKVIDYIGNHRTFLVKVRARLQPLLGCGESDAEIQRMLRLFRQGRVDLPAGCHVTYDLQTIDILTSLLRTRAADDAIQTFYDDFRERHGTRPTAVELYHAGYNPRSLRKTHRSWTKFLRTAGDLSAGELQAIESAGELLDALDTTQMSKSFKMLTLMAMLNRDAFPGQIGIAELTAEFRRIAGRSQTLRKDVGDDLADDVRLASLIERNPIAAWCGGKGTRGRAYFAYTDQTFSSLLNIPAECREDFQNLARELTDWRLAEYLDRGSEAASPRRFTCKVLHSGGRPILKLPSRQKSMGIPSGWVDVVANGESYVANFVKEFVNVVRADRESLDNVLADILRDWFGPDAGRPGTRFEVAFESVGDQLRMVPLNIEHRASQATRWRHYMREDIPPLFGLSFNPAIWNQGFIAAGDHVFLMVTLKKGGLNKDHRYEDHFVSADRFQWQSQNKTKQDSKHGRLIRDHEAGGVNVHLFIRRQKVLDGKAAPFVYCGPVSFKSWEGEQPISVKWQLQESVPPTMRTSLEVPDTAT